MSHHRTRYGLSHSFVVLALAGFCATAQAVTVIDDFNTSQSYLKLTFPPIDTSASSAVSGGGILGGERDLQINLSGGVIAGNSLYGEAEEGLLVFAPEATILGSVTVQWDGSDGSATLNPIGLGGVDLTAAGTQNGIVVETYQTRLPATVTLTVNSSAADASSATFELTGPSDNPLQYFVPFSAFTTSGGAGASFANVGAITMNVGSSTVSPFVLIEQISADVDITASTSATLLHDLNGDGAINPGDTVRVSLLVSNPPDGFGAPEPDVVATVPIPAGAVLVANSATTTLGTVTSGTAATDSTVAVAIGSIGDGQSATVTFDLVLQPPASLPVAPLSVQATLHSSSLTQVLSTDSTAGSGPTPIGPTFTSPAALSASQTVSTTAVSGGDAVYTVVIANASATAQFDNPGSEFTETFPAGVSVQSVSATSGQALVVSGNAITWDGAIPGNGSVTLTVHSVIAAAVGQVVSAQGSVSYDASGNGNNSATALSDDPGVAGSANPTVFAVLAPTSIIATQTVSGAFHPGQTVTYVVTLTNTGQVAQPDNASDEFSDSVPGQLTLSAASASAGTASASGNLVEWNGSIAPGASVTITYTATIDAGTAGQLVSNQGATAYDADNNGSNESTSLTDDPALPGLADPTVFAVTAPAVVAAVAPIPTSSDWALLSLGALLLAAAARRSRRAS